jgi:hypothetical protein
MSYVVRAKLKPLSEIPEEFLCCEANRKQIIQDTDRILEVLPGTAIENESLPCPHCGVMRAANYLRLRFADRNGGNVIPVPCFDFDEGIESGSTLSAGPEKEGE